MTTTVKRPESPTPLTEAAASSDSSDVAVTVARLSKIDGKGCRTRRVALRDGTAVTIRPGRPADRRLPAGVSTSLMAADITAHGSTRLLRAGSGFEMVVAEHILPVSKSPEIVAAGLLAPGQAAGEALFIVGVAPQFRCLGLGTAILARIIARARERGFARLTAKVSADNPAARAICRTLGFREEKRAAAANAETIPVQLALMDASGTRPEGE